RGGSAGRATPPRAGGGDRRAAAAGPEGGARVSGAAARRDGAARPPPGVCRDRVRGPGGLGGRPRALTGGGGAGPLRHEGARGVPDLACYGKVIGGGYPVSAVAGRRDLLQLADPGQKGRGRYCFLSGTLTGNPVACAAGLATLEVLRQQGAYQRLHALGERLAQGLR